MPHPSKSQSHAVPSARGWSTAILLIAAIVCLAVVAAAGLASAKASHPNVATAHNGRLHETVLVDPHGFTLYELSPETTHHLLCKASCLPFWPALKAPSVKARLVKGAGVKGQLATMRRNGFVQITLNGRPLYRFSGDSGKGQAHGDGISSFGGTWHVVKAGTASGGATHTTTTSTSTTTTTTSTSSPYTYRMY